MPAPELSSGARAAAPRASLRRLWPLFREERPALALATLLLLVGSLAALAYPQGVRIIVDGATSRRDPAAVRDAALLLGALAVLQGLAVAGRAWLFGVAGERGVRRVREQLFRSLVSQEVAFFDGQRTGALQSRLASDTAALQALLSSQLSMALRNGVQVAGALALLVYTSPRLTAVMLSVIPAVAFGAVFYGRKIRGLSRRSQDALAEAGHVAEESLSAIRTVRAFAAEDAEDRRYGAAVARAFALARARVLAGSVFLGATYAGVYAAIAVVLGYGGALVAQGALTAGALTAFLVYTLLIAMGLGTLADNWAEAMRGLGAAERVFELVDRAPAMALRGGRRLERVAGRVAFEDVRFSYPLRPEAEVLHGIELVVEPGEVVALVGPSGAGKSTLGALLVRLYDPSAGRVTLDGHDLRELDPSWLRAQVGVVSQEPVLFSTSVAENVRYGRPGASDAEVREALAGANALDFVQGFPDGLATRVGERGQQLSGGQKQRVAIARAILKDPRLLLLDEATSALDAGSEALVQEALARLMRGRTAIVIAHRLSTVVGADRVVVIDGGRVIESGGHAALVSRGGAYARLVERQVLRG
ncbi:ABC transporter ATP-binding protein [Anaeromyxobacter paludicola]|uniref:ABC transporter n=1 Tax=Anaeromyxobacter paludicola TaxID=2918171 RepID=A0ABM7XDE7_9BACT|nr:ABC transporter transmembrane domain-containing protein [Anaeromyxobacter paludicola]BDG09894.1 ABC transporter [Anaeromyxobacter paludicola]